MCLRRHSACASQLLLFYLRTRASLTLLIQMELVLHGYQRKIFPTMPKNLRKQALLEDLTTTDAWTGMCLMVSQQFWFSNLLIDAINHLLFNNFPFCICHGITETLSLCLIRPMLFIWYCNSYLYDFTVVCSFKCSSWFHFEFTPFFTGFGCVWGGGRLYYLCSKKHAVLALSEAKLFKFDQSYI